MNENSGLGVLVSNILEEKCYSHCRLCLQNIQNDYFARFQDEIAIVDDFIKYIPLTELLTTLFGEQILEDIPGIEAVCDTCIERAVASYKFTELYKNSTLTLHKLIDDLNSQLPSNIETNEDMFIVCREDNSEVIVKEKDNEDYLSECDWTECDQSDDISHFDYLDSQKFSTEIKNSHENPAIGSTEQHTKQHVKTVYNIEHVCKECGKSCKGLKNLRIHEQKHLVKHECPKCGKAYSTKDFYNKHVKLCTEGLLDPHPMRCKMEKAYYCDKCGKGYSTPGGLRVHERFTHENAQPHVCSKCGKSFTAPSSLKTHLVTHSGEKNFPCNICGGKFVSKGALLYHTRRHTGEKPYSCDTCDEKFVNASARADHIKHKHIGPTISCQFCTRKFVTKNFLRLHLKKHHDPSNKIYIGNKIPN